MKQNKKNPYATVSGGKIQAPHKEANPKAVVTVGSDLRAGKHK